MEKDKIIIMALIAVIAILLVGIAAVMPNMEKQDTDLKFKGKSTLAEGDALKIKLTDASGTPLPDQQVNATIEDKDGSCDYHSAVTNEKGNAKLKLDKAPGKYEVTVSYGGSDGYNGCNATEKIKIEEKVVQAQTSYDPGAFYSAQAGKVIYTGEVHDAPDGHKWKHLGNNEWVKVD